MKPKRTNNEWVYAAPSGIHGSGLFARTLIPAGTDLVEYDGPRVRADEGQKLADTGNVYIFRLNRRESIDGSAAWNLGRHANHSCAPNAKSHSSGGRILLRAIRPIQKGEEITYDYGYTFRDEPTPCRCGTPSCVGIMVAEKHRGKI